MKKEVTNEFKDGLNLDLNPIVTPNTVLTDNLNGTFITYNGNEFCLQNDRGNIEKDSLTEGYVPIGIKERNGILYIVSVKDLADYSDPETTEPIWATEIGYFPNQDNRYERLKVIADETSEDGRAYFTDIVGLNYDPQHPITIEIQDSYDGSVNLILVDDKNPIRIVNTGFSKEGDNYTILNRKQIVATNIYDLDNISDQLELIRNNNTITNIDLLKVISGGQFKGGNYTFYIKFGDADYNQTDVVAESGIVSIFKGNDGAPATISGTLLDERTDKMINLRVTGINTVYSKIYIYYTREYSDTQGYRMTESGMFIEPIDLHDDRKDEEKDLESESFCEPYQDIWLSGFEQTQSINIEELNIDYHTIDAVRAEAQQANMLFLGNVSQKETFSLYNDLETFSKNIENVAVTICQEDNIGSVNIDSFAGSEYYDTQNIYYKLGYWPDEYYRLGIVYILKDGSTTPVFNIKGGDFIELESRYGLDSESINDFGVFKTPRINILASDQIKPIAFKVTVNTLELRQYGVSGYFIVRQKRIPTTICQGLSIGIDSVSHIPFTWNGEDWVTESFLSYPRPIEDFHGQKSSDNPLLLYNDLHHLSSGFNVNNFDQEYGYIFRELSRRTIIVSDNSNQESSENNETNNSVPVEVVTRTEVVYSIAWRRNDNGDWVAPRYGANYTGERTVTIEDFDNWDQTYNGMRVGFFESDFTRVSRSNWITEKNKFVSEPSNYLNTYGLLSLDPCVNSSVSNILDGSKFKIRKEYNINAEQDGILITNSIDSFVVEDDSNIAQCVFVSSNTPVKVVGEFAYSTVAGNETDVKGKPIGEAFYLTRWGRYDREDIIRGSTSIGDDSSTPSYKLHYYSDGVKEDYKNTRANHISKDLNRNINLVRGKFTSYVGIADTFDNVSFGLYSIINNSDTEDSNLRSVREQDISPFYAISKRFSCLESDSVSENIYRGDCYTCTIGMRMIYNFIDSIAPAVEQIVTPWAWSHYITTRAEDAEEEYYLPSYENVNLSDVNTVSLGYWVTFKCLSSYNLGLRSIDSFHTDEMALLGSARSFYPLNGASTATGNKMEESFLLNDGYSATVGEKRYDLLPDVPYSKSEFANRIMFSNVHITDAFTNGYRTFQGLSYKDYDKQYGEITKLISYGSNLFVVMEHGLGLVPVNEKALLQTTTGEAIHIYGYGVLPNEMTIISQDYGSKYEHSIVRTPIGVYGMDVDAKKIWRFSDKQGFETFSDMKIETLLKDCLESFNVNMSINDVRTHYNAFKGDLMFTWYITEGTTRYLWNICYNERQNVWVTRYGWVPIISENINDSFYSLQYNEAIPDDFVRIWSHTPDSKLELPNPTNWYNRQHPFEFEFVVSDPIGINKIFDNLQIISNNTQPNELEISIIGDSYIAKRKPIVPTKKRTWDTAINTETVLTTSNIRPGSIYGDFKYDWRLNENLFVKLQEFKDIYKFGRRIGNIHYRDGIWYSNIEPILLKRDENDPGKQARIRDKWARIRIRYSGEDMAVITAIKTLINI